jgi:ABC-type multidrug transport system permease subunit
MKNKFVLSLSFVLVSLFTNAQYMDNYFIDKNKDSITQVDGIDYLIKLFKIKKSQEIIEN